MKTQIFTYFKYASVLLCSMLLLAACSKEDGPENLSPKSFKLMGIADGTTDVELQPQLKWESTTGPDGDKVTYQVYLSTQNPPQESIANNLDVNTFSVEDALQPETTYYWKVIAKDSHGNTTESNVASFSTRKKNTEEALIGKWFYESISGERALSDCEKRSFILFTPESTARIETRFQSDSNKACRIDSSIDYTYKVIGDEIIMNNGTKLKIESVTDTKLVLTEGSDFYTFIKE